MKILVTAPYSEMRQEELKTSFGEVIYKPWKPHGRAYNESELIELLSDTRADALITEHDHVTAGVIEKFPYLRFIGVCRGTPSNVAVDLAREKGISVFHTPGRNAQAVAELFVASIIILLRKVIPACNWLEEKQWKEGAHSSYLQFKGNELANKTIGMVGFGDVGRKIAHLIKDFPCKVQFYDPYVKNDNKRFQKVSLDEVFKTSDIVSIHLPVNAETTGMIDKTLFSKMKKNALFANTARAAVVNREDLLEVLENNEIGGAYLDVYDHEPPDEIDYRIIHSPNVFATPHIAGATHEVEDHHAAIMNEVLIAHLKKDEVEKQ